MLIFMHHDLLRLLRMHGARLRDQLLRAPLLEDGCQLDHSSFENETWGSVDRAFTNVMQAHKRLFPPKQDQTRCVILTEDALFLAR